MYIKKCLKIKRIVIDKFNTKARRMDTWELLKDAHGDILGLEQTHFAGVEDMKEHLGEIANRVFRLCS
jgi:hypothetical protein